MHVNGLPPLTTRLLQELSPAGNVGKITAEVLLAGTTTATPARANAAPPPMLSQADVAAMSPMMMAILVQTQFSTPQQDNIDPDDARDADESHEDAEDAAFEEEPAEGGETSGDDSETPATPDIRALASQSDNPPLEAETASLPWEADAPSAPQSMAQAQATFYRHQFD